MKTGVRVEVGRIGSGTGKPQGPEKRAPIPRRVIFRTRQVHVVVKSFTTLLLIHIVDVVDVVVNINFIKKCEKVDPWVGRAHGRL